MRVNFLHIIEKFFGLLAEFFAEVSGKFCVFCALLAAFMLYAIWTGLIPVESLVPIGEWMADPFMPYLSPWDGIAFAVFCSIYPFWVPLFISIALFWITVFRICKKSNLLNNDLARGFSRLDQISRILR